MKGKEPAFDGARLWAMRKQRGLSVRDVELRAGVSARHVWRLEAGKRPNVAAVTLARIALAVGVDLNYLLGLSDSPRPFDKLTESGSEGAESSVDRCPVCEGRGVLAGSEAAAAAELESRSAQVLFYRRVS